MYNIYAIQPNMYYQGLSLVAAASVEEANEYIDNYIKYDKNNALDSWGYSHVNSYDLIEDIKSDIAGIVYYGISYRG